MFFIDFDGTLYNTHLLVREITALLATYGVSEEVAIKTRKTAVLLDDDLHYDYTFERHLDALQKESIDLPRDIVLSKLYEIVEKHNFVKDDAATFLQSLQQYGRPILLLTAGNETFQHMKINSTGLAPYFNEVITVHGNKEAVVKQKKHGDTVFFINDKVPENELVKKELPEVEVITYHNPHNIVGIADPTMSIPTFETFKEITEYVDQRI